MATDSMTVKIAPNDKGNTLGKLADAELRFTRGPLEGMIARDATPTTNTESSPLEHSALERHYRIGELAEMWQLGRETVRLLERT